MEFESVGTEGYGMVGRSLRFPAITTATAPLDGFSIIPTYTPLPNTASDVFTSHEQSTRRAARTTTNVHTTPPTDCGTVTPEAQCKSSETSSVWTESVARAAMDARAPEDRGADTKGKRNSDPIGRTQRVLKKHKVEKVAMDAAPEGRGAEGHDSQKLFAGTATTTGRRRLRKLRGMAYAATTSTSRAGDGTRLTASEKMNERTGRSMHQLDYVYPARSSSSSSKRGAQNSAHHVPGDQQVELADEDASESVTGSTAAFSVEF